MNQVIEVEARPEFRLWLRFSDDVTGEVDLSHLAGRGVFGAWNQPSVFESVRPGPGGSVVWPDEIELCPDSLYLKITGNRPEELFPPFEPMAASA